MSDNHDEKHGTSSQIRQPAEDESPTYASPPCSMHELDPSYLGYLSREETLALLNELLEEVRAEAYLMHDVESLDGHRGWSTLFRELRTDQARFNVMLIRHIERLGGTPSEKTGETSAHLADGLPLERQLHEFNTRQHVLYAKLKAAQLRIYEDGLREDLANMLESRERLIQRCSGVSPEDGLARR